MSENIINPPAPENFRERLKQLREALLQLHKALVDSERVSYEKTMGTIPSPGHLLQLLTRDPWFAWLHPLSQLIIAIDVALDAKKEPLTAAGAEILLQETRTLLIASENSEAFSRHYFDALQRDPDVVFAHANAANIFKAK